jgi:hypothetical protein
MPVGEAEIQRRGGDAGCDRWISAASDKGASFLLRSLEMPLRHELCRIPWSGGNGATHCSYLSGFELIARCPPKKLRLAVIRREPASIEEADWGLDRAVERVRIGRGRRDHCTNGLAEVVTGFLGENGRDGVRGRPPHGVGEGR